VLVAEYLIRHGRDVKFGEFEGLVGPDLLQAPQAWTKVGLSLEDLVSAEFGDLYRLKVDAWYLHRGRKSYRASGSEERFWAGLRRIGGDRTKVEGLKEEAKADPKLRASLMDFVVDLYYARIARVVGPDVGEDVKKISLADAVAASACFPPVFAPYSFLGLYDDRHVPTIRLTDGGVFDNQGLTALFEEECTHIIASDAGGLLEVQSRAPGSRIPTMGRIISVLMGALRGVQLDHLREERRVRTVLDEAQSRIQPPSTTLAQEAEAHKLKRLVFFHMTTPPERGSAEGLPPHESADAVARVRTDLDAFGDAEIGALVYQGYSLCDRFVRKYLSGDPYLDKWSPARVPPTPERLPDDEREREQEILETGSRRFFRALRLGVVEAWIWTAILAVLLIGGSWMVRLSVHDLADGAVWFLGLLQIDVESRVPLGLVIAVVLAAVGLRLLWPWAYGKLSQIRRAATALKWMRAFSGSLLLLVLLLPVWIALVVSLLALFSHLCHTRPFLRMTKVPKHSAS
ncbi:MAG: hypothetical protein KAJ42_05465, partial [Gemmatimonadetes bacterium]|nr:hypothetical protein [Gemmatimonadota bacterium]